MSISRRLPADGRGQKRSTEDDGEDADQREPISRRLPDDGGEPASRGAPHQFGPDMAGGVTKLEKKKVKWNSVVEEFEAQATWGGARRDVAVARQKLGCDHDVFEFYSPPRVVKMARELGMKGGVSLDPTVPANGGYIWDFNWKHCRDRALQIVTDQRPPISQAVSRVHAVLQHPEPYH